jgi:hypothetical protein
VDIPGDGSTSYITAAATAGPSGVQDITCTDNGAPAGSYPAPPGQTTFSAQIPVSGLGAHQLSCTAQNNAADSAGVVATSAPATSAVSLREPTSADATFGKVVDAEKCTRARHHRRVCRPRTIKRRELVLVKRHGRTVRVHRVVRIVVFPHVVERSSIRVRYGRATTVSGAIGAAGGALSGATVTILAAPDNGASDYTAITTATTNASGTWTARIPAGPSRLIEATYPGSATTEPITSAPVTVTVPAKIRIASIRPRRLPWGSTITITGLLDGGYLPPGGALVELRYGYGRSWTVYGVKTHVTTPTFTTTFTFGPGQTPLTFKFQMATLPAGNFPYTAASSNTVDVRVGGRLHTHEAQSGEAQGQEAQGGEAAQGQEAQDEAPSQVARA